MEGEREGGREGRGGSEREGGREGRGEGERGREGRREDGKGRRLYNRRVSVEDITDF